MPQIAAETHWASHENLKWLEPMKYTSYIAVYSLKPMEKYLVNVLKIRTFLSI